MSSISGRESSRRKHAKKATSSSAATAGSKSSKSKRDKGSAKSTSSSSSKRSSKSSRSDCSGSAELDPDDMAYLLTNTSFTEDEIREWHEGFMSDCPDGKLTQERVHELYDMLMPTTNTKDFVVEMFRIFDSDGSGAIDFREFMTATSMTMLGTLEVKLKWIFRMFDVDNSGTISQSEMARTFRNIGDLFGHSANEAEADEYAARMFAHLDKDGSGEVDIDEFVQFYLDEKEAAGGGGAAAAEAEADDDDDLDGAIALSD